MTFCYPLQSTLNLVWTREGGTLPAHSSEASGLLTINNLREDDSGVYVCTGSDLRSVAQDQVKLLVEARTEPIKPIVSVQPVQQNVRNGESVEFKCKAEGYPRPKVLWRGGRKQIFNNAIPFSRNTLKIERVSKQDESEYYCIASNSAGSSIARAVLFVIGADITGKKPMITMVPTSYEAKLGETVSFECRVSSIPLADVSWRFEKGNLPDGSFQVYS